jgi:glycosyltransferase involved in cell wall biosynthesis
VKIIHIAPTPFFSNRGCHIRIRNEIEGLVKNGVDVVLCTYGLGSDVGNIDVRRICSIPCYTQTKAGFSPYKFVADFFLFFLVLYTAWKEKPDVLHGHLHEGALIGWGVKTVLFWRKIKLLMDMQGSLSGELSAYGVFDSFPAILRGFYFVEKIICHFPKRILCSSQKSVEFLVKQCGLKKTRIALFEDVVPDSFLEEWNGDKLRKRYRIPDDKQIVIYTGSFLSGKGITHLLDAIDILLSEENDLFFLFVGYPKEIVEEYIQTNDCRGSFFVAGEVAYDELALWLSLADLAVDPKEDESGEASGKILHYMAAGLPVVCFRTINNCKYLGENAFFAKPGSARDMAVMIKKGVQEIEIAEKYGRLGKEKIKADYSIHSASKNLINFYLKLLN